MSSSPESQVPDTTATGTTPEGTNFIVKRDDWRECRFVPASLPRALQPGQVLLRVDRFALTANNISYALAGDMLGYWSFFPADPGWGRIPVMGFGDVLRSEHHEVGEGERVFGFFPMSTHLVVQADSASPTQFVDAAPHRRETAPVYRQYSRAAADPLYDPAREDHLMLLRGLFLTSFLVDDFMADNDFFGAQATVLSSASSKTAIALAFLLARRPRLRVIGLTSARNVAFVEGLGCYDQVITYEAVKSLPADVPAVLVDMAGDGQVLSAVHHHFGDRLKYSCLVGATHWDRSGRPDDLPGAQPQFFFAPSQIQKRSAEWGPAEFQRRLAEAWRSFVVCSDGWLTVVRSYGRAGVERVFRDTLEGNTKPSEGYVLSLWQRAEG
jgi:hypothetical protein